VSVCVKCVSMLQPTQAVRKSLWVPFQSDFRVNQCSRCVACTLGLCCALWYTNIQPSPKGPAGDWLHDPTLVTCFKVTGGSPPKWLAGQPTVTYRVISVCTGRVLEAPSALPYVCWSRPWFLDIINCNCGARLLWHEMRLCPC
jgi:hypothetical protein